MYKRQESGQRVQSDDIEKHKRDVYRISFLLTPQDQFIASEAIKEDIRQFLKEIENDPINTKAISRNMGLPEITQTQFIDIIRNTYGL